MNQERTNPTNFERVRTVFHEALAREVSERSAFLRNTCGPDQSLLSEVERLLDHHNTGDSFLTPLCPVRESDAQIDRDWSGRRLGAFRLLRPIGAGGMGAVWLAERVDGAFEQRVAVKLLHQSLLGSTSKERFDSERNTLAQLEHPYIARIIDGGTTTDGIPFFVMEYVEGVRIDDYCHRHSLSITKRVQLFRRVCEPVQYAHQRLIIHCDLKPSNILVTSDGSPKIIDFGIARLLQMSDNDQFQNVDPSSTPSALTPTYASPEQLAGGAVTTASDVYALGVVLHKLITGKHSLHQHNDIHSTAPSRERCRSDVDYIVSMATQEDAADRYDSVEQFAADVQRHTDGFPVLARMRSPLYVLRRFVRRHAIATSLFAALVLALIAGVVGMTTSYVRETAARKMASRAEAKATAVADFLQSILTPQPRFANGSDATLEDILAYAETQVENLTNDETKAAILQDLGHIHQHYGDYDRAGSCLTRALSIYEIELGSNHRNTVQTSCELLGVMLDLGEFQKAAPMIAALEETLEANHKDDKELRAELWFVKGIQAYKLTALHEARQFFGNALAELRLSMDPDQELVAKTLSALVDSNQDGSGDLTETLAYLTEATAIYRSLEGKEYEYAGCLTDHAHILARQGNYAQAEAKQREYIGVMERLVPADQPTMVGARYGLASILAYQHQYEEAEEIHRAGLAASLRTFGESNRETILMQHTLAWVLVAQGKFAEAHTIYGEAIAVARTRAEAEAEGAGVDLARLLHGHARLLHAVEDYEGAKRLFNESLDIKRAKMAPRSNQISKTLNSLGLVLRDTRDFRGAEALLREAGKISGSEEGVSSPTSRLHSINLGIVLCHDGRHEEAEPILRRVLKEEKLFGEGRDYHKGLAALALAQLLCVTDRATEGEVLARDGIAQIRQAWSARHWRIGDGLRIHGECLAQLEDPEAARVVLTKAYESLRHAKPVRPRRTRQALEALIRFHETHGDEKTVSDLQSDLRELPKDSLHLLNN